MKKALRGLRGVAAAAGVAVLVQGLGTLALGPAGGAGNGEVAPTTRGHVRTAVEMRCLVECAAWFALNGSKMQKADAIAEPLDNAG